MVSAKKEKKGTGAERRRAEAAATAMYGSKPYRREKEKKRVKRSSSHLRWPTLAAP